MATSGSLLSTKIYNGSTNFYFQVDWVATQDEKQTLPRLIGSFILNQTFQMVGQM